MYSVGLKEKEGRTFPKLGWKALGWKENANLA